MHRITGKDLKVWEQEGKRGPTYIQLMNTADWLLFIKSMQIQELGKTWKGNKE